VLNTGFKGEGEESILLDGVLGCFFDVFADWWSFLLAVASQLMKILVYFAIHDGQVVL